MGLHLSKARRFTCLIACEFPPSFPSVVLALVFLQLKNVVCFVSLSLLNLEKNEIKSLAGATFAGTIR